MPPRTLRLCGVLTAAFIAFVSACAVTTAAPAGESPKASTAASRGLEDWPVSYGAGLQSWRDHRAAPTRVKRQLFVYRGRAESQVWGEGGPQDGSRRGFLYGDGWSKGRAVYDPVHRIAYLNTGCCTEFASVLTLAPPPPEPLPARDLTEVHTTLGLRLGDSPERVRAVLGVDTEHAVEGFAGLEVLSYYVMQTAACGTWHNVYFRKARAVRIEVVTAC